jgi:hypothetical protein
MLRTTKAEGNGGDALRRMILLLAVAAVMAAMMAATAGPALAKKFPRDFDNCGSNGGTFTTFPNSASGKGVKVHSCN